MTQRKSSARNAEPTSSRKKPYRPPALIKHGSLLRLTKVKGGMMNDGAGKPMTKSGGMNA